MQNAPSASSGPSFGEIFSSKHHSYGLSSEKKVGPPSDSVAASTSTSVVAGSSGSFKKKSTEGPGLVVKKGRILSDSDSD